MITYTCEIKTLPSQPTLFTRATMPVTELPTRLGQLYGSVMQAIYGQGAQPAGAPYVAYYNMDMQALEIEAGFPLAQPLPGSGEVQAGQIPAGEYASVLHVGPYPEIGSAYKALNLYLQQQTRQATGVSYEFYLNDPTDTPADRLETEILFPLQPVSM
jgi:effector-binding domain-containing protein